MLRGRSQQAESQDADPFEGKPMRLNGEHKPGMLLRLVLRPETLLTVVAVFGFLSLTVVLLRYVPAASTMDMDARPWPGGSRNEGQASLRSLSSDVSGIGASHSSEIDALTNTLKAMDLRLAALDLRLAQASAQPQTASPAGSVSQAHLDFLMMQVTDALKQRQQNQLEVAAAPVTIPVPAPPPKESAGRSSSSSSSNSDNSKVEKELKSLQEAVNRLSHQTDDRFSTMLLKGSTELAEGHACRSPPCSRDEDSCKLNGNCCKDLMYEMLSDFSDFLTRNNVTHFVVEGTLLGGVREKDIIPYTADVDLMIPRSGWEKAKEINKDRSKDRSYTFMQDPHERNCARLCAVWNGLPVNRASFDKSFEWDTEQVGNDLAYFLDIYDEDMDFAQKLKHLIYPLSNVTIRNRTFPAPREKELYVEARYGPSWRTPDHQARELESMYPTLDEGKKWSENMLLLQHAQEDATTAHRLLERATVDHKTGDLVVASFEYQRPPSHPVTEVEVVNWKASEDPNSKLLIVQGGTLKIKPPTEDEGEVLHYVLYWAAEMPKDWDVELQRLDIEAPEEPETSSTTSVSTSAWWIPFAVKQSSQPSNGKRVRPFAKISRCSGAADPFKACGKRGEVLSVPFPPHVHIPLGATHVVVTTSNEAGESSEEVAAAIGANAAEVQARTFSHRVQLGFLQGFASFAFALQNCTKGSPTRFQRKGIDDIIDLMIKRTTESMRAALVDLSEWLSPMVDVLKECPTEGADELNNLYVVALKRLKTGQMEYIPGKVLSIDGESLFLSVNSAIGKLRKGKHSAFASELGSMLRPLALESKTATSEKESSTKATKENDTAAEQPMLQSARVNLLKSRRSS